MGWLGGDTTNHSISLLLELGKPDDIAERVDSSGASKLPSILLSVLQSTETIHRVPIVVH